MTIYNYISYTLLLQLVVYWSWPEGSSIPRNGDFKLVYTVVTNRKHFWVKTIPLNFSSYNWLTSTWISLKKYSLIQRWPRFCGDMPFYRWWIQVASWDEKLGPQAIKILAKETPKLKHNLFDVSLLIKESRHILEKASNGAT